MKKVIQSIKSMTWLIVVSLIILFVLEFDIFASTRQLVASLFPILKGKREFLSNFYLGVFASSLVAWIPIVFEYNNERENFVETLKGFYLLNKNILIGNNGNESIEDINALLEKNILNTLNHFIKNFHIYIHKRIIRIQRVLYEKVHGIPRDKIEEKIIFVLNRLNTYYKKRLLLNNKVHIYRTGLKQMEKIKMDANFNLPDDFISRYEKLKKDLNNAMTEEKQLCDNMMKDEKFFSLIGEIDDELSGTNINSFDRVTK